MAFQDVRVAFENWAATHLAAGLGVAPPQTSTQAWIAQHMDDVPILLWEWHSMDNNAFAASLVRRLGPISQFFGSANGRTRLLQFMIDEAAEEDPQLVGFLLYLKDTADQAGIFMDFLQTLTALAQQQT
jgi:hypothetical protein